MRLASGDPAIYGGVGEMVEWLKREGVAYEVVPGVSSFLAAAAALGHELTVPDVAQTIILTRTEGRTECRLASSSPTWPVTERRW